MGQSGKPIVFQLQSNVSGQLRIHSLHTRGGEKEKKKGSAKRATLTEAEERYLSKDLTTMSAYLAAFRQEVIVP
jgi:hypothetical protein